MGTVNKHALYRFYTTVAHKTVRLLNMQQQNRELCEQYTNNNNNIRNSGTDEIEPASFRVCNSKQTELHSKHIVESNSLPLFIRL